MHQAELLGPSFGARGPCAHTEEGQAWGESAEAGLSMRHVYWLALDLQAAVWQDAPMGPGPGLVSAVARLRFEQVLAGDLPSRSGGGRRSPRLGCRAVGRLRLLIGSAACAVLLYGCGDGGSHEPTTPMAMSPTDVARAVTKETGIPNVSCALVRRTDQLRRFTCEAQTGSAVNATWKVAITPTSFVASSHGGPAFTVIGG